MSLRMADGPPLNLPAGCDAYAGYVDSGGIGITWPAVQRIPARFHLSISVHGAPAMCADVENGALSSWKGYTVGYCSASQADALIARDGRPTKLWTAHYDPVLGAHICGPTTCGLVKTTTADGTQWTDHGNVWDESLLSEDFFDFLEPAGGSDMADRVYAVQTATAWYVVNIDRGWKIPVAGPTDGAAFTSAPPAGMGLPVITGKFTDAELADIPTRRDSVG